MPLIVALYKISQHRGLIPNWPQLLFPLFVMAYIYKMIFGQINYKKSTAISQIVSAISDKKKNVEAIYCIFSHRDISLILLRMTWNFSTIFTVFLKFLIQFLKQRMIQWLMVFAYNQIFGIPDILLFHKSVYTCISHWASN